jgi:hypothetical protein
MRDKITTTGVRVREHITLRCSHKENDIRSTAGPHCRLRCRPVDQLILVHANVSIAWFASLCECVHDSGPAAVELGGDVSAEGAEAVKSAV